MKHFVMIFLTLTCIKSLAVFSIPHSAYTNHPYTGNGPQQFGKQISLSGNGSALAVRDSNRINFFMI